MNLTFVLSKYTQLNLFPFLLISFILELFIQITVRLCKLYEDKNSTFLIFIFVNDVKLQMVYSKTFCFPGYLFIFFITRANTEGRSEDKGLKKEQEKEEERGASEPHN